MKTLANWYPEREDQQYKLSRRETKMFVSLKDLTKVSQSMYGKEKEKGVEIANIIWSLFPVILERRVTNAPLRQRRVSSFVTKQKESLGLLPVYFRCLAGFANKHCVKSIARTL